MYFNGTLMEGQTNILNPTVSLYGWEIREPVTSMTDFLTAMVCFYAFAQLVSLGRNGWLNGLFKSYFLLMGIGMIFAGLAGHAMQAYLAYEWKMIGWVMGAFAFLVLEWISVEVNKSRLGSPAQITIRSWIPLHLILFLMAISLPDFRDFTVVKINSTIALMGVVLPMFIFHGYHTRHPGSRWIIWAIIFGIIPAIVYNFELSLGRWFNYHDISHVLMATYTYMMYRGAREFALNH